MVPANVAPSRERDSVLPEASPSNNTDAWMDRICTWGPPQRGTGVIRINFNSSEVEALCQFFNISSASMDDMYFLWFFRDRGLDQAIKIADGMGWKYECALRAVRDMVYGNGVKSPR